MDQLSTLDFAKKARGIMSHIVAYYSDKSLEMKEPDYRLKPFIRQMEIALEGIEDNTELNEDIRLVLFPNFDKKEGLTEK